MKPLSHLAFVAGCLSSLLLASCATAPPVPKSLPAAVPARYEASFDCNSPETDLQDFICRDEELAALDRSMANEFHCKVRTLELLGRTRLLAEQRRWLLRRETRCRLPGSQPPSLGGDAAACLKDMYRERIAELAAGQRPQSRQRQGSHPLSAYVEFKPVDDREPALCATLGKQFNDMIAGGGQIDPATGAGFSELTGSHGAASFVRDGRKIEVHLYDAGPYASYQLRAKRLTSNGQTLIKEDTLPDWIAQLPNSGGSFSNTSSQTLDYAAIDVFATQGREFVLVNETWGYYAAAASGESPHAGVYELVQGQELRPLCLYRTYLTPPAAKIFDRLPLLKELQESLHAMSGKIPPGLTANDRLDQTVLERELIWTLFNMPLIALDEFERNGLAATLRRRHDAALNAIFAWSERNLPSKLLYRRLFPMIAPAHTELTRSFRTTQGLRQDQATAAADLLLMAIVDEAAENLEDDAPPADAARTAAPYTPRFAVAPAPGDLEKGRTFTSLHSAALNHAPPEVISDFIKFETTQPASARWQGPAGDTPLMAAVRTPDTLKQLLAAGAAVNGENDWHKTALMTAAQTNQLAGAGLLLKAGADVQRKTVNWYAPGAGGPDQEEGAIAGRTALMYAASGASAQLLRLLIEYGAAVNASDETGASACDYLERNTIVTDSERKELRYMLCGKR